MIELMVSIFLKEVALGLAAFFIRSASEGEKLLDSQQNKQQQQQSNAS